MPVCVATKTITTSGGDELVFVPSSSTCAYQLVTQEEFDGDIPTPADFKQAFDYSFFLVLACFLAGRYVGAIIDLVRRG